MNNTKKKTRNDYVDNDKFQEAIVEYRKRCDLADKEGKERPIMPNYIGECIQKIAQNYFLKPRFNGYSYEDDMVSEAVITCVKYFDTYNPDRGNPFAYFTSVVHNAFLQVINTEERNRYKMIKNFTQTLLIGNEDEFFGSNLLNSEDVYDNMYSFMQSYEEREAVKKSKKKASGLIKIMEKVKNEKQGKKD